MVYQVIISDLTDYDELHTGQRREGTYVSISAMPNVFMGVAGRSLPLLVIASVGYTPNVAQSDEARQSRRLCHRLPALILRFFPVYQY